MDCAARKHNGIDVARKAAIRIQANWRVKMARKEFLKSKTSAVLIQSGFRGARARGELAMQVRCCLWSDDTRAVGVCMHMRMDGPLQRAAALMFQSAWRCRQASQSYKKAKQSATLIQVRIYLCLCLC